MRIFRVVILIIVLGLTALGCWLWLRYDSNEHVRIDRRQFPVAGIDVSAHNGEIDFSLVAADSIEFVYVKSTEGGDFRDKRFESNLINARQAGLKVGPYHFFRFNVSGSEQARNMLATVGDMATDLPWAIDVESWGNDKDYDRSDVIRQLRGMVDVLRGAGKEVMIYTNKNGYGHFIAGNFADVGLWLCSKHPVPPAHGFTFWQYSHKGKVGGVNGFVDMNAFRGNRAEWIKYLNGNTITDENQR